MGKRSGRKVSVSDLEAICQVWSIHQPQAQVSQKQAPQGYKTRAMPLRATSHFVHPSWGERNGKKH
jgi:hypothetical protein